MGHGLRLALAGVDCEVLGALAFARDVGLALWSPRHPPARAAQPFWPAALQRGAPRKSVSWQGCGINETPPRRWEPPTDGAIIGSRSDLPPGAATYRPPASRPRAKGSLIPFSHLVGKKGKSAWRADDL